jgi:hypothetical protein
MLVAAGLAGLLAACGGDGSERELYADAPDKQDQGDRADPGDGEGELDATTPAAAPTPVAFDQVKGEALTYDVGGGFTVLAKPLSSQWLGQFDDEVADPGSTFLVVYVAHTPKLKDRGVSRFKFGRDIDLRFAPANSECEFSDQVRVNNVLNCAVSNKVILVSKPLSDPSWPSSPWQSGEYGGADLVAGVSYVTALAFPVPDETEVQGGFQLCAKEDEYGAGEASDPCVPIPGVPARDN